MNAKNYPHPFDDVLNIIDNLRKDRGLPRVRRPRVITRTLRRQVTMEAWSKYPGALTQESFELGPLTLALVEKDIENIIRDLETGTEVIQGRIPDYNF